jgi:hypothetical protein
MTLDNATEEQSDAMFQLLQDGSSCNTFIRKKINQRSTDYCSRYEKCPFKILRADDGDGLPRKRNNHLEGGSSKVRSYP